MKTTPDALKDLYEALGGDASAVAELDKTIDVLNAFAAKYEGNADAVVIPEAIENIAEVADNIGGGGFIEIALVEQQTIQANEWHSAEITPAKHSDLAQYDGMTAKIIFDGREYAAPIWFTTDGGDHLNIGEWDDAENWYDFTNVPVGVEIAESDEPLGYAYLPDTDTNQHTLSVYALSEPIIPSGTIEITENGTVDVTEYASAGVNVQPPTKSVTVQNASDYSVELRGMFEEWDGDGKTVTIPSGQTVTFDCEGGDGVTVTRLLKLLIYPNTGNANNIYASDSGGDDVILFKRSETEVNECVLQLAGYNSGNTIVITYSTETP